jgi:hypothetical protein
LCGTLSNAFIKSIYIEPILFVIYINGMSECVNASTYLFADDTKIYKEISCEDDVRGLQADLDQLFNLFPFIVIQVVATFVL